MKIDIEAHEARAAVSALRGNAIDYDRRASHSQGEQRYIYVTTRDALYALADKINAQLPEAERL